jgi:hypothetical protein
MQLRESNWSTSLNYLDVEVKPGQTKHKHFEYSFEIMHAGLVLKCEI